MYKLKAILKVVWMIILPLAIGNIAFYLIGAFVALDPNPMNWWILCSIPGRIITAVLEMIILANIPYFWDEFQS